jgi:type IV secretion system protein VirB4
MNPSNLLKTLRKEVGVSKHISVSHLNSPTVAETKNGEVFSVIGLQGVAFQTEQNETINQFNRVWQRLLSSLDETISLTVTVHRRRVNNKLEGNFTNNVLQEINDDYMTIFNDCSMFMNDIYITVLYRGLNSGKMGKGIQLFNRLSDNMVKEARGQRRRQQMRDLDKTVSRLMSSLTAFTPKLLGSRDHEVGYSELLNFLSKLVNGGQGLVMPNKGKASAIGKTLPDTLKQSQIYPQGNLSQYLPLNRLFFGDDIQFKGLTESDNRFAGILSIKSYADESASVILNTLLHLNCEWISTHSFSIEAKDVTMKKVKQQGIKLSNVNDAGVSQLMALNDLQEDIQTGLVNGGYHHHSLMILADDKPSLDLYINQAARCYLDVGFAIVREELGQEAAYWAQFPGNHKYIARSALITSQNFADFCPLHNYKIGYTDGNHLGSAVTLLETTSKTPYFFNFHKKGSSSEITPGHTTIIGSNGAGKTVLMTFFDAQVSRYQGRSVFFDRDRGAEIYVRSTGGVYSILSPDHPEESSFNPLLLPDTKVNRKFCKDWLAQLCKKEDEATLDAELLEPINTCVDYAFDKLDPENRQLSYAVQVIPVDFERWPQLRRWIRGDGSREEGDYAYLFDNASDALHAKDKMGFDMTHFLDNEPSQVRTALLMYLFHWIKANLDGKLMAIWLDEAWQYFVDPYWEKELKKTLPTFRKLNAFLVMATQSASSVAESSLRNMVMDNSATQIFFPNPDGRAEYYQEGFSLSAAEFEFIKENEAKSRQFLIKQGHDSAICKLDLSHMLDKVSLLSADKKSIRQLDQLREKWGNEPEQWLPHFLKNKKGTRS